MYLIHLFVYKQVIKIPMKVILKEEKNYFFKTKSRLTMTYSTVRIIALIIKICHLIIYHYRYYR